MKDNIKNKIKKYKKFWKRTNKTPLIGFSLGSYFISKRFNAVKDLLVYNQLIKPDMLQVEKFRLDYLRMYEQWSQVEHDIIFTGAPFLGLPWMEAMLGCEIYSTKSSFVAHSSNKEIDNVKMDEIVNQEWLNKYMEFTNMLQEIGKSRFPVGQPIMRGPSDIVGTILGQEQLVYHFYDNPKKIAKLLNNATDVFLHVIREQKKYIDKFFGGNAMGFYDLWCPGNCIWFQDDLNALLSPMIYEKYVYDIHIRISKSYDYSMIHLHPASFFVVDYLLEIKELDAIQINKDEGGPSVEEMLPVFQKVQPEKNLVLWGDFTESELNVLTNHLGPEGLYIIIFSEGIKQIEKFRSVLD